MAKNYLNDDYTERLRKVQAEAIQLDTSILSAEDIAEIDKQAELEVLEEKKKVAKDLLLKERKKHHGRQVGLEEKLEDVVIDLAPYCDRILLDNRAFLNGVTYTVPVSTATVMREIMQRTWTHQAEIDGKSENFYRRTRGAAVSPRGVVNGTSALLRA